MAHRFHVVQHLVHGDPERVLLPKHALSEGIVHQDHLDAGFVHQARGGVVVGGKAGDRFVSEFLDP